MLALELMENNGFQYILTYKYSQDHLELMFACILGNFVSNTNQNLRTFKAELKKILLKTSIIASKHTNCIMFEEKASNLIFLLKWTKNCTRLEHQANVSNISENNCIVDLTAILNLSSLSPYKISILSYIGSYVIQILPKSLLYQKFYCVMWTCERWRCFVESLRCC